MSAALLTAGCSATERLWVDRAEPARIDLPGVQRLGVVTFEGEAGDELTRVLVKELDALPGLSAQRVDPGEERPLSIQGALLLAAQEGLQALLGGRVELFEIPTGDDPDEPAHLRLRYHAVVREGGFLAAPPLAITLTAQERGDEDWRGALLGRAVREIAEGLHPRTVAVSVEWEFADGYDEEAWERFASGDYSAASAKLTAALTRAQEAAVGHVVLGALYYDQGLCYELLGKLPAAERAYDEALTLSGLELHITVLRALRGRMRGAR